MATYSFRSFFDSGSGVCLWAANDRARERFGYAVETDALPVPESDRRRVRDLIAWADAITEWRHPVGPCPSDDAERLRFHDEARAALETLRRALGPEFEILNEFGTADGRTP